MVSTTEQTPAFVGNSLYLVGRWAPAVQMNLRILKYAVSISGSPGLLFQFSNRLFGGN